MIDPTQTKDLTRLCEAVEGSRRELQPFREKRMKMIRQFVGSNYGDINNTTKVPVPLLEQAVSVYSRALVSRNPGVMISSNYRQRKPAAAMFQLAGNHAIQKASLEKALRDWVVDAMFGIGVLKMGIKRTPSDGSIYPGQVIAAPVNFDDFVMDTAATRIDSCRFYANRYTAYKDDLIRDKSIGFKKIKDIPTDEITDTDEMGDDRSRAISGASNARPNHQTLEDQIELYDVYLTKERLMVTVHLPTRALLRVAAFDGPIHGPFHLLGFGDVPGNLMPLSPAALLFDLHDLANRLFRKVARQAERQKTLTVYQGASEADADRVKRANDGETVRVDRTGTVLEQNFGGANQVTLATFLQIRQMFSMLGGNLDALAGLAPQSQTLGQDRLLTASASQRIAEMQSRVLKATSVVTRDFMWYIWTDRLFEPTIARRIPGVNMEIPVAWTAEDREGDFLDYNFEIDPTSMAPDTPEHQIETLSQLLDGFILKLMPFALQQGITLDVEPIIREAAQCLGRGDVDALLRFTQGAQNPAPGPMGEAPGMPANTNRTYTRVNRPGNTVQGQESSMIRQLMGVGMQPAEASKALEGIS